MSNSQEQSLDEDARILPVLESSPQFLHCEKERRAVEKLMSEGQEAFYDCVAKERCSCFLSPEEVEHISSWVQDYHCTRPQVHHEENGVGEHSGMDDFHSTYYPCHTDVPVVSLDLGWPERSPWLQNGSVMVYSSPPTEGRPSVREIIRWHLQNACQVIAIVTDSLTDALIIEDLHAAASRGVPVYIILNHRSVQENVTLNRLKHPNIRVRVLGGKAFCSRTGQMVIGEMKEKFLLVDLKAVIHGSYSLTWTDAHLHRQMVTVLCGPVVDLFDTEFRVRYAASLPCSGKRQPAETRVETTHRPKVPEPQFDKQLSGESEIPDPQSPPADSFLDWEAMGVLQIFSDNTEEMQPQSDLQFANYTPHGHGLSNNGNQVLDMQSHLLASPTEPTMSETIKRVNKKINKALRQLSKETSKNVDDTTRLDDGAAEEPQTVVQLASSRRLESCTQRSIMEQESDVEDPSSKEEKTASRKALILRVPEHESFNALGNLMKKFRPQPRTGLFRRTPKDNLAQMTHSMLDLTALNLDEKESWFSRFKPTFLDSGLMTPASALMQNRNMDKKVVLPRTPKTFLSIERPRNSNTFASPKSMESQKNMEEAQEKEGQG